MLRLLLIALAAWMGGLAILRASVVIESYLLLTLGMGMLLAGVFVVFGTPQRGRLLA